MDFQNNIHKRTVRKYTIIHCLNNVLNTLTIRICINDIIIKYICTWFFLIWNYTDLFE